MGEACDYANTSTPRTSPNILTTYQQYWLADCVREPSTLGLALFVGSKSVHSANTAIRRMNKRDQDDRNVIRQSIIDLLRSQALRTVMAPIHSASDGREMKSAWSKVLACIDRSCNLHKPPRNDNGKMKVTLILSFSIQIFSYSLYVHA